jgi:ubiquinone/menaquinone biosynthesis C-methylase UbiE
MARVLKPGGTMAITTEVILNDVPHPEFFVPEELYSALVRPSGLQLLEEIDFAISPTLVDNPIDLGTDTSNAFPHIVCKAGSVIFTSVIMFLQKLLDAPPQESETNTRFSISSTSEKSPATTREKQPLLQGLQTISHRFWPRPNEKKQPGLRLPGSVRRAFRNIDERSLEYSHQWDQLAHSSATYSIYATSDQAQFEQGGQDDTARISQWVRPNSVVLDVGCGIGRVEKYLAPFCQELHALDVSEEMLSQARRRLAGLSDVFLHHASATDLSFAQDNTFDLVFSLLVLQHMEKEDAFLSLREIHRVLKPDGLAYLQFPNLFADVYFQNFVQTVEMEERPVHRMRLYTPQEVAFFLDKVGFDIKEQLNEDVEILVLARKRGKQTA